MQHQIAGYFLEGKVGEPFSLKLISFSCLAPSLRELFFNTSQRSTRFNAEIISSFEWQLNGSMLDFTVPLKRTGALFYFLQKVYLDLVLQRRFYYANNGDQFLQYSFHRSEFSPFHCFHQMRALKFSLMIVSGLISLILFFHICQPGDK